MIRTVPSFRSQATEVAAKEVRRELRTGEVMWVTIPFGAMALLLIPLAVGTDLPLLSDLGAGLYWVVVLLFGVLVAVRRSSAATDAQREMLALSGLDPAAEFVGQTTAATGMLLIFEIVVGAVAVALYNPGMDRWPWLFLLLPLVAVGMAMLGTLAGAITASLAGNNSLVPFLVAPLAIPLLLGATQAMEAVNESSAVLGWLLLMMLVDLALAIVGVLTARPLQESQ